MADLIQCPCCLMWLNMEFREARIIGEYRDTFLYECKKCGSIFSEDREVIWKWNEGKCE